jgi:hypothetical protein
MTHGPRLPSQRHGRQNDLDRCNGVIMTIRTLLWRGLDALRLEIVHVESLDRAHGTQIGIAYELRWKLDGTVLEPTQRPDDRDPAHCVVTAP